ncbi:MAG: class I SAM-dependent methyltransferase [Actinobacteria bacterium]|nr:MAG: class I SAM-dependent methyltransferase [Actinomycetota bacterium]
MPRQTFDAAFFKRFYSTSPVHSRTKVNNLAAGVHAMCQWWEVPVRSVLDVGAGLGYWRDWYATNHPKVKRLSVDISEHACEKYHHECHDIATWFPSRQFDLVVCHSVLQYLNDKQAATAIGNLAKATRSVLYLEVPTSADLRNAVDKKTTDLNIYSRTGEWYRKRLSKNFVQAGAGLWVARNSGTTLYELERSR